MQTQKTVLVLSGGGLFGAWQVGAWSVLREHFHFDAVIGASIGSLNGWAIAGGATPEDLTHRWLEAASTGQVRLRFPKNPLDGCVEFTQIEGFIRTLYEAYRPQVEYYAVVTDILRLKPCTIDGAHVQWQHLAASCALLGALPQQRIDRILYTDGGFLGALPLWAARQCHATKVIGLNVMPRMPWPIRAVLKPLRSVRGRQPKPDPNCLTVLSPSQPLGTWKQACVWDKPTIEKWINTGRQDAEQALALHPTRVA
jgi:predicted acylesterase/phospholipase RssA